MQPLPSSAQHIRALAAEEMLRNSSSNPEIVLMAVISDRAWPERAEVSLCSCKSRIASSSLLLTA
ncbi:MAG: hypothetical protein WCD47_02870, partial [Candidatus Sulfotelmatobacter sp.]